MTALGNDGKAACTLVLLVFALAAVGCAGSEMAPPDVEFTPSPASARNAIVAPSGTLPTVPAQTMTTPTATSPTADQPTSTTPAMQQPVTPSTTTPTTGIAGSAAPDVSAKPPAMTGTAGSGGSSATPPAMMAGSGAEPMMPEQPATTAATSLAVTVTTVTQGGRYAPINVGAIWIEDSSGKWVDTLEYWDSLINARWLTAYSKAGGVSYDGFFTQAPPDVIASATLKTHKTHTSKWDFKDSKGTVVPDGTYHVVVELTEASATGKTAKFEFTKGAGAMVVPTTDDQFYKDVKLELK